MIELTFEEFHEHQYKEHGFHLYVIKNQTERTNLLSNHE